MKQFLKESPAFLSLIAMVIALILLSLALIDKDWIESGVLVALLLWIFICIWKDHIIWKLTKRG